MIRPERSKDAYRLSLCDLAGESLVVCPACGGRALVTGGNFGDLRAFDIEGARVVCPACGYNKQREKTPRRSPHLIFGMPVDPFFHLPLWLQVECCGELLWAYNVAHLEFLRALVAAKLRERNGFPYRVRSIGARLPRWMTSAKNRDTILHALGKLAARP